MSAKSIVLVVDSSRTNLELLSQQLGQARYQTLTAAKPEELDQVIQGKEKARLL